MTRAAGYRNSQLAQARLCPHAYRERYVLGRPGIPSPSLQTGRNIHRAVGELVRRVVDDEPIDVHDIAYRTIQGGGPEYADALRVLIQVQERLAEDFEVEPGRVFLLEERLEIRVTLPDGSTELFHGTPDMAERFGRRCRVTDFKTHWHPEDEEAFLADPQVPRYALLIAEHFPVLERFELIKRFVRYRGAVHRRELARGDLEPVRQALAAELLAVRDMEEEGAFPATGGGWCGVCEYHASCPLIARLREEDLDGLSIAGDAEASELAGGAIALDAAAARIKDQLKRYLLEHPRGRVPVPGGHYGYGPVVHRTVDVETLSDTLATHGAAVPADVLQVDMEALDRLLSRSPDRIVRAVEKVIRVRESSQCRFRRGPAEEREAPTEAREEALLWEALL